MTRAARLLDSAFATLADLIAAHAAERPGHPAIIDGEQRIGYGALDAAASRVAAALQRDGLRPGDRAAILAGTSARYVELYIGILRAGGVVTPLPVNAAPETVTAMLADSGARFLFADCAAIAGLAMPEGARRIAIEELASWCASVAAPALPAIAPEDAFNIIYSSGTTGTPKGIVQSHAMRWAHVQRGRIAGYAADAITLVSTPFYSNTTLVSVIPALAFGGTLVLMRKFDAAAFLALAEAQRVTHAMLVPVQYARIMALPGFGDHDLSAFRMKTCTSAPFAAALKADIVARWPGGLVEIYGLTEGGATATLAAHLFPDKLHTVGRPVEGHVMRLIDEQGREVRVGEAGEVVGRSPAMMTAYHGRPRLTAEAEWFDREGRRYLRTGDIGRFDADGFLTLIDRRKEIIISGGFNIYPSDLEAALRAQAGVAEAAVVGVPSDRWGETPVAFVVASDPAVDPTRLLNDANAGLGKTQRIADLVVVPALPRSAIGKILKRDLRDAYLATQRIGSSGAPISNGRNGAEPHGMRAGFPPVP